MLYMEMVMLIIYVQMVIFQLECMGQLREFVKNVDWPKGLAAWNQIFSFHVPIATRPAVIPEILGQPTLASRFHQKKENNDQQGQGQSKKKNKRKGKWSRSKRDNSDGKGQQKSEDKTQSEDGPESQCKDASSNPNEGQGIKGTEHAEQGEGQVTETTDKKIDDGIKEGDSQAKKQRTKLTTHNPLMPAFRVTCNRTGSNHCFDSMGAAANFGGGVNEYFGWNVSMKNFDIEVLLNIDDDAVRVCIALTKESLHKRNLVAFGHTTLRPTIAYCMLR